MVILLLFLSLSALIPDMSVTMPDSVRVGDTFTIEITLSGIDIRSVECNPRFSVGLRFLGSSTMHSFSRISTPSGYSMSSEIRLSMSFTATEPGTHTLGPFVISASGTEICEVPIDSVIASGEELVSGMRSDRPGSERIAWIEIEIDTTGRVFPGQTFNIDYYIYKTRRNAEIVDLYLDAADYASSHLIENSDELGWVRCKDGPYRAWLGTLEVTPAFACSLRLPVLGGRIGIPGGFFRSSFDYEQSISTEDSWIAVYPFPEEGKPDNFYGITDSISFQLDEAAGGGYSLAGEKCIQLSVTGPGTGWFDTPPEPTVSGPASIISGSSIEISDEKIIWEIILEPSDSGTVIIGPDSIAWFNTDSEIYNQAVIPACTISVHGPYLYPVIDLDIMKDRSNSSLFWISASIALLAGVVFLMTKHKFGSNDSSRDIREAHDTEELLTALEYELSKLLTGSPSYLGSQELDEALEDREIDNILSGRLLRHWKDIEMVLSGREISAEKLVRLKLTSIELIQELSDDLNP